ncbi:Stc1 domain-containing protein [Dichotomocladium elegans]|nr:Stc1 domain-containing protein [Dichotomocladium elegans]
MSRQGPAGKFRLETSWNDPHGTFKSNDQQPAPKSLKCVFCNQEKRIDAFSKTQVQKATFNPYAPAGWNNKKKTVVCKQCTAKQTVNLTCMTCTKTKPLEQFAKNQRRHAEKARCLKCMKKREEEDVQDSDPDDSSDDEFLHETWHDHM